LQSDPLKFLIGAVSVGVWKGQAVLDLDYAEDSTADTDMNVVVAEGGGLIEVQGTAEGAAFERTELNSMLDLAVAGGQIIINKQREALSV
jgi:ribonuclease PH